MTKIPTHDVSNETRVEFLDRIAKAYEVPMNLIRYDTMEEMKQDND